jgi:hypothetical protein
VNVAVLHYLIGVAHSTRRVIEEALLFLFTQHAEQVAGLRVVVMVILAEVELRGMVAPLLRGE